MRVMHLPFFLPSPSRESSDYVKMAVIKSRKEEDKAAIFFQEICQINIWTLHFKLIGPGYLNEV